MAGTFGIDVSQAATAAQWAEAMQPTRATFAAVRCYEEGKGAAGYIDPNAVGSIRSARQAGLGAVDVYHYPTKNQSATTQTRASFANLVDSKVTIGRYWLDIEINLNNDNWYPNAAQNAAFITEWVSTANELIGSHPELECPGIGIYSRISHWNSITGGLVDLSQYPLWFVYEMFKNRDGPESYAAFEPFGGWTMPLPANSMVQWNLDVAGTNGFGWDESWRPEQPVNPDAAPSSSASATRDAAPPSASRPLPIVPGVPYVVQPGDTLSGIAAKFGTTAQALRDANHLDSDTIHPNQTLNLS